MIKLNLSILFIIVLIVLNSLCYGFTVAFKPNTSLINDTRLNFNPGCGLELTAIHHRPDKISWYRKYVNIVYKRFHWCDLQPKANHYRFDILRAFIHRWSSHGYRVAFGIMTCSKAKQSTPEWVFDSGVPYVLHKIMDRKTGTVKHVKDPIFWNKKYILLQTKFIYELGKALNGGEGIEHIDIRALGTWGEMHLLGYTKGELAQYNFSFKLYCDCYKKIIDAFVKAFPKTILLLNLGGLYKDMLPYCDLAYYAAKRGVGFRFDGLSESYFYRGQKIARQIFRLYGSYKSPVGRPLPCLYEFARKETNPQVIKKSLLNALSDNVSYIHLNLGSLDLLPQKSRELIKYISCKIGYSFTVSNVAVTKNFQRYQNRLNIKITIRNIGNAMCPFDGELYGCLFNNRGKRVCSSRTEVKSSQWHPKREYQVFLKMPVTLPLKNKVYRLDIGLKIITNWGALIPVGLSWSGQECNAFQYISGILRTSDGEKEYIMQNK